MVYKSRLSNLPWFIVVHRLTAKIEDVHGTTVKVSDGFFVPQLTCTPSWMWRRLQTVLFLFWTPLRVGTPMATTVSPASLRRACPVTVSVKHSPEAS